MIMIKKMMIAAAILFLAACNGVNIPLPITTSAVSPTSLPAIFSPTPRFIPSQTPTVITPTMPATPTETISVIPTATTTPPQLSALIVKILGCDTSLDILHQMGEVTNAYPIILNYTSTNLTNVCAVLSASDEARIHPDKTVCIAALPAGNQVTLKLTVDTGTGKDTAIQVNGISDEGISATASLASCRAIGLPGWLPEEIGTIEPIP